MNIVHFQCQLAHEVIVLKGHICNNFSRDVGLDYTTSRRALGGHNVLQYFENNGQ